MGDLARRRLIIEIMGRHSNIILVDDAGRIIDSDKHKRNNQPGTAGPAGKCRNSRQG